MMQNRPLSRYTVSFGLALAISSLVNALLVMAKEKSPAVRSEMQKLTGSHWLTQVGIVLILFFALGFLLARPNGENALAMPVPRLIKIVVGGILAAGGIIVGFYLITP